MKIFLGYASEKLEAAREVYTFLKTLNDDVWFDKESLIGGDDWDRERAAAQHAADLVIHLISPEVFERPGVVNREIRQTLKLSEDQPMGATYVVFLRLADLRMPAELIRFQYIDYFGSVWRDDLVKAVNKRINQLDGTTPRRDTKTMEGTIEHSSSDTASAKYSRVENSISTEQYSVSSEHLHYSDVGYYWAFINARLAAEALEGFVGSVADFHDIDESDKERARKLAIPFEWSFLMQEFFRRGDFLSVRSSIYYYMGGAHGNHGITTLNFLGPKYGQCSIRDLLGRDDERVFRLVDYCKKVLLAMFDGEGVDEFIGSAFADRGNAWDLASQFNLDDRGLTINFSPYVVLPYAFGTHEVFVPWRFVTPLLDERYSQLEDQLQLGGSGQAQSATP